MIGVRAQQVKSVPKIAVPFAPLPLDLKARRDVSPAAKLVFATLANQARMRRAEVSNLTNRRIAERAGLTVATVRRALDDLEALGLIRRLFGDSKRIRLGVAVTYIPAEGVAHGGATPAQGVAPREQPGCAPAAKGGCAPCATDLLRTTEKHPETVSSLDSGEDLDPASRVAEGPEAARYLRLCIEAGKRGEAIPPPPCPAPASPRKAPAGPAAVRPPNVAPDDIRSMVGRMVGSLGERLKADDLGPRRIGPAKLARQLAEMRRRHGKPR